MSKKKDPFTDPDFELSYESDERIGKNEQITGEEVAHADFAATKNTLPESDQTTAYLDETGAFDDRTESERKESKNKNMFFNTTQSSE